MGNFNLATDLEEYTADERWTVLNSMFQELGLVRQHLDSFNNFIRHGLKQVIEEEGEITPEDIEKGITVILDRIEVRMPEVKEANGATTQIWPMEARLRNLTYASPLYLHMRAEFTDGTNPTGKPAKSKEHFIGYLPIMLNSEKCQLSSASDADKIKRGEDPLDEGGYFIVNGSERVLVTQEDLAPNRILVEKFAPKKTQTKTSQAKVFSVLKGFRAPVTLERHKDGSLKVSFPSVSRKISLTILLRALGMEKDGEIARKIASSVKVREQLLPILQGAEVRKMEEALEYIGKRVAVGQSPEYRKTRTNQVLDRYLLPHLGNKEDDRIKKANFLCQMAQRVLELEVGEREPDDKDHYANKRLNLAGDLILVLFRNAFRSLIRDIKYQLERKATSSTKNLNAVLSNAVRADVITERMRHALATGNWVGGKAGVSQLLDRTNYMSSLSHLRRVVSPLGRSQPHFEARDLHPTHWGKICIVPDSNVLLGDGIKQLTIREIKDNYQTTEVITVESSSQKEIRSPLADFQTISSKMLGKRVLSIKTISGREIRATEDHPFLTKSGWVEAGKLTLNDKLLIRPVLDDKEVKGDDIIHQEILSKETYFEINSSDSVKYAALEKDVKELEALDLLPLETNNLKLPILARLFGYALTDGSVNDTGVEFYLGSKEDAEAIHYDLRALGFSPNQIVKKVGVFDDNVEYTTYRTALGGIFRRLMVALGIPIGKRAVQDFEIPDWIFKSPKIVKREFLGGILGSDGRAPWIYKRAGRKNSYKIRLPDIEMRKDPQFVNSLIQNFEDLRRLFSEFDVEIASIKKKKITKSDRVAAIITFSSRKENILSLCQNIGYRYCKEKQNKSQLVQEFLLYRKNEIVKKEELKVKTIEMYETGYKPIEISSILNENYRTITSIIQRRDETMAKVHPKLSMNAGEFLDETNANVETGMLYLPMQSIEVVDEDIVMDFTTIEDTHSFIANGFVTHNCPSETPEGPNCGLVKNLALQAYISIDIDIEHVKTELKEMNVDTESLNMNDRSIAKVYLNGTFFGTHENGAKLADQIRKHRRNRIIAPEVNVAFYDDTNEVQINADRGRVRRPLIIVKEGRPLLEKSHIEQVKSGERLWVDLTRQGIIEYLDTEEEENSLIALEMKDLTPEHTHLEISPASILGICASLIPFPEHNRSDRNVYEAGMAKQSLGIYAANFSLRMDTRAHLLHYPQRPLVKTHGMDAIKFNDRPAGQNFMIALLSYGGYNMEDSLIINKASIDRGLGRSTFFRAYVAEERQYPGGQEDIFEVPSPGVRGYKDEAVYRHLSDDGVVEPETYIDGRAGEVIIGRTSPPRFLEERTDVNIPTEHRRETSTTMRFGETGTVDSVIFSETTDGHKIVKVRIRSLRIPELGDKFASRHGQKGVIGNLVNPADMPFNEYGLNPDIIINPHAIPSRMTIGQLIEILSGKLAAASGDFINATAFESLSVDEIMEELHKLGFHHYGKEILYDGRTGEKLEADVFLGIAFYQKLHHLVNDKLHARARGPVQILTRQPTEGRSREGGLKFGEMERDCLIGHGTSLILKERLLDESDKTEALFCEQCGFIAFNNPRLNKNQCLVCRDEVSVSKIIVSYAFKLLLQELMSMGVAPRIELKERT